MQIFVDADACPVLRLQRSDSGWCRSRGSGLQVDKPLSHKNHIKGPKKRTEEDDERFAQSFEKMILMAKSKEE